MKLKATLGAAILGAALAVAPPAHATVLGNFLMAIPDRFDLLHLGVIVPRVQGRQTAGVHPRVRARAADREDLQLQGTGIATHDVYSWDAVTLAGTLQSSSDAGCDGAPGGTRTYPFWLTRQ